MPVCSRSGGLGLMKLGMESWVWAFPPTWRSFIFKPSLPLFSPSTAQTFRILVDKASWDHPSNCSLFWNPSARAQTTAAKYLELLFNSFIYYFNFYVGVSCFPTLLPVSAQPGLCIMNGFISPTSGHTVRPMNTSWINEVFVEDSIYTQWFWMLRKIQEWRDV